MYTRRLLQNSHRSCVSTKCRSTHSKYHDVVHTERVFCVYYIGNFLNQPTYVYGEAEDTHLFEFQLKARLPWYKRVAHVPMENFTDIEHFEKHVARLQNTENYEILNKLVQKKFFVATSYIDVQDIIEKSCRSSVSA